MLSKITHDSHGEKLKKFKGIEFKKGQQNILFYFSTLNLANFLKEDALAPSTFIESMVLVDA